MRNMIAAILLAACTAHADPTNEIDMARNMGIEIQSIEAKELARAFHDNDVAANRQWKGRLICMTGTVAIVRDMSPGSAVAFEGGVVGIDLQGTHVKVIETLTPRDRVEIYGHCSGPVRTGHIQVRIDRIRRLE